MENIRKVYLIGCLDHRHCVPTGARTQEEAELALLDADARSIPPAECDWQVITLFLRPGDEDLIVGN